MINRRHTFIAALCALFLSVSIPLPLLATGGNDPVPGIDVII